MASDSLAKKISDLTSVSAIIIAAITAIYGRMWSVAEEKETAPHFPMIIIGIFVFAVMLCGKSNTKSSERCFWEKRYPRKQAW